MPKKAPTPAPTTPTATPATTARWRYDKGGEKGNRQKHKWDQPRAGFIRVDGDIVGKCPSNIPSEDFDQLLNTGVGVDGDDLTPGPRPSKIYVVHGGVVYRAKATNSELNTWHAFPADAKELQGLSDATWARIRARATELGCLDEVERWRRNAGQIPGEMM